MNRDDVIDILTVVAAGKGLQVGEADVEIWLGVIGGDDRELAMKAVRDHLTEQPGVWLEPGHVHQRVRAYVRDQLDREPESARDARQEALAAKAAEDFELLAERKGIPQSGPLVERPAVNPLMVRCPWCHAGGSAVSGAVDERGSHIDSAYGYGWRAPCALRRRDGRGRMNDTNQPIHVAPRANQTAGTAIPDELSRPQELEMDDTPDRLERIFTCYLDAGYSMSDEPTRLLVQEGSDSAWAWLEALHGEVRAEMDAQLTTNHAGAGRTAGTGTLAVVHYLKFAGLRVWSTVRVGGDVLWVTPGWYRRERIDGWPSLTPIRGWRLVLHRVLWGFQGLVDAR